MVRQTLSVDAFWIGAAVEAPPDLSVVFIMSLDNLFGIGI
jgi:hypothetical protein